MNDRLPELREALLNLHKALVESERVTYEQAMGHIQSPNHFLQLLTTDPWFAWLHPLSNLIVAMDEAQDGKVPPTPEEIAALVAQTRALLVASETGEGFAQNYYEALQRDADVVFAHGLVMKALGPKKPKE